MAAHSPFKAGRLLFRKMKEIMCVECVNVAYLLNFGCGFSHEPFIHFDPHEHPLSYRHIYYHMNTVYKGQLTLKLFQYYSNTSMQLLTDCYFKRKRETMQSMSLMIKCYRKQCYFTHLDKYNAINAKQQIMNKFIGFRCAGHL